MIPFSNPLDVSQLCNRCIAEVGNAARRNTFTVTTNITDAAEREAALLKANESGKRYRLCSRCALRPAVSQS